MAEQPNARMAFARKVRERFDVEDTVASTFSDAEAGARTWHERFSLWMKEPWRPLRRPEYLLPRLVREIRREWPSFMIEPKDLLGRSRRALEDEVRRLGPWSAPFELAHGVTTMPDRDLIRMVAGSRLKFRRDLITGTVAELVGDSLSRTSVLDIGCNSGFFSLDVAARGARHVDGVDLRSRNIAQARFLADHYGIDNVSFSVGDAADMKPGQQWDAVLNLGVLYHVTEPVQLLRRTYELCRDFAVIDTNCHLEPVSGFFVVAEKDVERPAEGREPMEFLPTYRAAIDAIRYVGFSQVLEVVGKADRPHKSYASGHRRCFLAIK
jgi:SAM-dependent methyltransferase